MLEDATGAIVLVDRGVPFRGMNTALFHSQPGLAQMYYAMALKNDGLELNERDSLSPAERASQNLKYSSRKIGKKR